MPELITIGETMAALVPEEIGLLRYQRKLNIRIAGAESNLAMGVAKLNHSAAFISRLGKDEFGELILREVRAEGVDCSGIVWDRENSTGVMFKQMEAADTKVFYYRANSAASHMEPEDLDEKMFEGAKILHITGITPVLSESCEKTVLAAIEIAKRKGVKISFDPNIRKKLWKNKDYTVLLSSILMEADIVEMGLDEGKALLKTDVPDDMAKLLLHNKPSAVIVIKNGKDGAICYNQKEKKVIPACACKCIEPIGAGDAFNAGFLSGILENKDLETCGKMGAIAGAMATEVVGDVENQPDAEQMKNRLNKTSEVYR